MGLFHAKVVSRWSSPRFRLAGLNAGVFALALWLAACSAEPTPDRTATQPEPTLTVSPVATATPVPPSPTPIPLAARVNGEPITLADYQRQLDLFNASLAEVGTNLATGEASQRVMDELIAQTLLGQAAREAGFVVDDDMVAERTSALIAQIGGEVQLDEWQAAHGYTAETLRSDLARAIAAAWMRDQILAAVPEVAEQVHARQILLYNSEDAQRILNQLETGADFADLARAFDPQGYGDLGWFPRAYLTEPDLEAAAFSLQPGEISGIVQTRLGYHILQVIERLPERPLDPDAALTLKTQVLDSWLEDRRAQSQVEILVPNTP